MQVNSIQQINVKHNSYTNLCNIHTEQGIPAFKGINEVKAARKIVYSFSSAAAGLSKEINYMETNFPIYNALYTKMMQEICTIYKFKFLPKSLEQTVSPIFNALNCERKRQQFLSLSTWRPGIGGCIIPPIPYCEAQMVGGAFIKMCEEDPQIAEKLSEGVKNNKYEHNAY